MRLTIVQYAGDYREAVERFAAGGKATYQAQRYSVDFVGTLAGRLEQVAVVCATTRERYDETLANGVRAIGLGLRDGFDPRDLVPPVAATAPDRLCLTTPQPPLLRWAAGAKIRTMLLLADSFAGGGLRARLRNHLLARRLDAAPVEWIGNHGLNACLSLLDIGVSPARIVPWDWPPSFSPHDQAPRTRDGASMRLCYVGSISEAKGVGDLLEAIALLRDRAATVRLTVYGNDPAEAMQARADALGLGDRVTFAGLIANEDVPAAMRAGDAVVVPSRHAYPEGLPLTIYEALASRTPLIASDHPMFRGALRDGASAIVFRASDVASLADAIAALDGDAALYRRLSVGAAEAWDALQLPVRWGDMFTHWLADTPEDHRWLADHAVASGRYEARLAERRRAMAAER